MARFFAAISGRRPDSERAFLRDRSPPRRGWALYKRYAEKDLAGVWVHHLLKRARERWWLSVGLRRCGMFVYLRLRRRRGDGSGQDVMVSRRSCYLGDFSLGAIRFGPPPKTPRPNAIRSRPNAGGAVSLIPAATRFGSPCETPL